MAVARNVSRSYQERLEKLFYQATNPCNDKEDVNVIKQFCDCVSGSADGPMIATRLLAHKIQSPHDHEAILALTVLEAAVKSCGQDFHVEVGKFRFLNEMVKLVSPKYSGTRTPDHVKLKVIELLYLWTKQIPHEKKILEAYEMLKSQGLIESDPDYVIEAVFPTSLSPRKADLGEAESKRLQQLLHSSNPEDIQAANQIIKGMVKKEEEKMEKVTKRLTLVESVTTNIKLLTEMLDNYDANASNPDERELINELGSACEKVRPNIYRVASEMEEGDEAIAEILVLSDELTKVIDRYRCIIIQNKPDPQPSLSQPALVRSESALDSLLDLNMSQQENKNDNDDIITNLENMQLARTDLLQTDSNNVDLMSDKPSNNIELLDTNTSSSSLLDLSPNPASLVNFSVPIENISPKASTDPLDLLGETLLKENLPTNMEPSFDLKKNEKLPLNVLMKQKSESVELPGLQDLTSSLSHAASNNPNGNKMEKIVNEPTTELNNSSQEEATCTKEHVSSSQKTKDVNLNEINLKMSEIVPAPSLAPMVVQSPESGVAVTLHFTQNHPQDGVGVLVLTLANHHPQPITDIELRLGVSKGWKYKLQPMSCQQLSACSAFSPPATATAILLLVNTASGSTSGCQLSYFLSYNLEGESVSDMGKDIHLPEL